MQRSSKNRVFLGAESLEERTVLSAAGIVNGELVIQGSNYGDEAQVDHLRFYYGSTFYNFYRVTLNGKSSYFRPSDVTTGKVRFYGYDGDDSFKNNTYLQSTAYGHGGNDVLVGGKSRDYLYGGDGHDYLSGREYHDYLIGGAGNDQLWGGDGHDWMSGGSGHDQLWGGDGHDWMYGNDGNDWLLGGAGYDRAWGGSGWDLFFADVEERYA